MDNSLERHWEGRARFLTQALILSGTLNIGFLSASVYFALKDKQAAIAYEVPTSVRTHFSNDQILKAYSKASFQELLLRLESKELMEEGCVRRELALACLSAFHHFPVEKALGGEHLQKRVVSFRLADKADPLELIVFVGLTDEHFEALLRFAKTEKWPLTSKGLFLAIAHAPTPVDPSLLEAFYCTAEFHGIYSLLQRHIPGVSKILVVSMLREGSWSLLEHFSERLRVLQQYTVDMHREILVTYATRKSSKIAADLLWKHDLEYVLRRLDDPQMMAFLECQKDHKERAQLLAKELLVSLRSDSVRQKAAGVLYATSEEPAPAVYDYEAVLERFYPERVSVKKVILEPVEKPQSEPVSVPAIVSSPQKAPVKKIVHKVQERDSLWKISRKYKVSVEAIMKLNKMETDKLRVGKEIQIPEN
jgi:LysM repeat protein